MPYKGQAITALYFAEDVSAGGGKTGDNANHAIRRIVDGSSATITASPAEVDATNLPGWYSIAMTAAENSGDVMAIGGKSTTGNVIIRGTAWTNTHNMAAVLGSVLSETSAGYLAAAFKKLFDVASPVLTAASVDQTGDSYARIGAGGASLSAIPWNPAWDPEVESECADALAAVNLDHLVGTATGIPAVPAGTYLDQLMDDGTATYDRTTDSLQAIRDRGDAAWTTATGFSTLTTSDIDARLAAIGLDHLLAAAVTGTDVVDNSVIARLASKSATADWDTFNNTTDSLEAIRDNQAGADAAAIADAVWDEDIVAAHGTGDTAGYLLSILAGRTVTLSTGVALGSALGQLLDNGTSWSYDRTTDSLEALRDRGDAAWVTATGFATAAVCTEARLAELDAANLPTDVAGVKTDTAAILVDTGTDGVVVAATSKTGYALTGAYDPAKTAAQAGDAMALTASERNSVADVVLGRSVATVEATAAEWSLCTIILAALESSISGETWTIKKTDGVTTYKTKTVTKDAAAEPITGVA